MTRKQLQNNHIATPCHRLQSRRRWHYVYESVAASFCEYGGTQNRPEYDEKPMDMPPMDPGTLGGILPYSTLA